MPAEAVRLQRRIGDRDRRFFAALACAALVGTPAIVLVGRHGSGPVTHEDGKCVAVAHAGVLGGGTYHYCGAEAVAFCHRFATEDRVAAKCETLVGQRATSATPR
jgi:hypothetical protein